MVNSLCQLITGLHAYLLLLICHCTGCRYKVVENKILINWQWGCFSKGYTFGDKGKGRLRSGSWKVLYDYLEQVMNSRKEKKKLKKVPFLFLKIVLSDLM